MGKLAGNCYASPVSDSISTVKPGVVDSAKSESLTIARPKFPLIYGPVLYAIEERKNIMAQQTASKYPRPQDVALLLPPIGGLGACPLRRQAELSPCPCLFQFQP